MAERSLTEREELLVQLKEEVRRCVNCGFCESVCPTLPASGFRPTMGARGRVDVAKFLLGQIETTGRSDLEISETFYSCLDCYACVQVCPAGVNAGKVSEIGKRIVAIGGTTANKQERQVAKMIVETTRKFGNPLGVRKQCADWSKGLAFDATSDTLLYTGNMYQLMAYNVSLAKLVGMLGERGSDFMANLAARYPSVIRLTKFFVDGKLRSEMNVYLRNIYRLLKSSGLRFDYLHEEEPYPGTLLYDFGYLSEFADYGKEVVNLFKKNGAKKIITIDPHTYDVLKNKYPKYVSDFDFDVIYYLDYVKKEQFDMVQEEVTLHEPCYFSLREDTYSGLPRLLESITHVKYPARSGKRTMCCGGPDEALFVDLSQKISEQRLSQLETVGPGKIITACPICYANLRNQGGVEDISTFLVSHLRNK